LLGVATYYLLNNKSDNNFALTGVNIENITTIELADINNQVVLTNSNNAWLVSSFKANEQNVSNLKNILLELETQYPLPNIYKSDYPNSRIINEGIHIKVYTGKAIVKDFYMYHTDSIGTIGLLGEKKQPYILGFPRQDIDIADYIVTEPTFWENNIITLFNSGKINQIKVDNHSDPNNSFTLKLDSIVLFDLHGNIVEADKLRVEQYVSYFNTVSFEHNLSATEKQELAVTEPLYTLSINTKHDTLTCHIIPIKDNRNDNYGNPLVYNRDFFNFVVQERDLYVRARWLKFDILFEDLDYLRK